MLQRCLLLVMLGIELRALPRVDRPFISELHPQPVNSLYITQKNFFHRLWWKPLVCLSPLPNNTSLDKPPQLKLMWHWGEGLLGHCSQIRDRGGVPSIQKWLILWQFGSTDHIKDIIKVLRHFVLNLGTCIILVTITTFIPQQAVVVQRDCWGSFWWYLEFLFLSPILWLSLSLLHFVIDSCSHYLCIPKWSQRLAVLLENFWITLFLFHGWAKGSIGST